MPDPTMTDEQIDIALAEADGWRGATTVEYDGTFRQGDIVGYPPGASVARLIPRPTQNWDDCMETAVLGDPQVVVQAIGDYLATRITGQQARRAICLAALEQIKERGK